MRPALLTAALGLGWFAAPLFSSSIPTAPSHTGAVDYTRTVMSVREFTKPRSFLGRLGEWVAGPPENPPRLVRPYAVTHDSLGRLIVADPGERSVHIFDFEKHKYQHLKGARREAFLSPIGVACDGADNLYVSDSARGRIYVFNSRGKPLRILGTPGRGEPLQRPTGLVIDRASRRLYVTDTLRHQLLVLSLDGALLKAIGRRGAGPGEFNFPTGVALSGGALYVVDAMNFRIQALTPDGAFLGAFGSLGNRTGTLNRPKGIAADSDGHLYVADALFETVQVFDSAGRLLYYFGSGGSGPGQFQMPAGIYIDPRDNIYIADSYNQRVQVFRYRRVAQ